MKNIPTDPFEIKKYSKLNPYRLLWTAYSRCMDLYAEIIFRSMSDYIISKHLQLDYFITDPGLPILDTAHPSNYHKLLIDAAMMTNNFSEPIVEIGSYRGVATQNLALTTQRIVYAVDPYLGYGGWESDLALFRNRVDSLSNVCHVKETSGKAWPKFRNKSLSLLYIDAVPDYSNIWFNFCIWGSLVQSGGLIALAAVDNPNYPGANLVCHRILKTGKYILWGYCPNLTIVKKV